MNEAGIDKVGKITKGKMVSIDKMIKKVI